MIIFINIRGVRVDKSPWPKSGLLKMRTKSGLWSILEAERVNIEQPQRKDNRNYDANLNTRGQTNVFVKLTLQFSNLCQSQLETLIVLNAIVDPF